MFGSNKEKDNATTESRQVEEQRTAQRVDTLTFIGPGVEIEGSVMATAPLRIDGVIRGQIDAKGEVSVGESGYIEGQVHSESILIAGQVDGNVSVTKQLRILPSGRLIGDAKTPNLIIEEGALFKGECEMTGPVAEAGARAQAARNEAAATSSATSTAASQPAQAKVGSGSTASATANQPADTAATAASDVDRNAASSSDAKKPAGEAGASKSEASSNGGRQAKKTSIA